MVVEADEYDRRFLHYWPEVAIVTSIEPDHLDYYRDLAEIRDAFQTLVDRLPAEGRLVVCADEPCASALHTAAQRETYGFSVEADWRIRDYAARPDGGSSFVLETGGRGWPVRSPLVGEHNARNVAAAIAVADYFGVGLRSALAALPDFEGPRRRFETRGRPRGIWLVDDYGHHPTEVAAAIAAARERFPGRRLRVLFQPHLYSRTRHLAAEFAAALADADEVTVTDVYPAREAPVPGVTGKLIVDALSDRGVLAGWTPTVEQGAARLDRRARDGDVLLVLGAGDVDRAVGMLT
jgi:UDP-N-acetylmuramate--alanine ligase